jgi:transposase
MGEPGSAFTPEQRVEVERHLRRTDLNRRVRERLEMVKAAALGDDVERIACWSGRVVETVEHWLDRFAAGGVTALVDAPRTGRPVRADGAYSAALEAALETPPRTLGLACDVWTSERLSAYLEQQTGVHIGAGWLRALLAQHGWVSGRPKHTLKHLLNPVAVAASRAELGAVGEKGAGGAGAVRTALSGRDASGDQSVSVPGLASPRPAADPTGRGDQSARHGLWQRRAARPHSDRAGARGPGQRRVRALPRAARSAQPGGVARDLPRAR